MKNKLKCLLLSCLILLGLFLPAVRAKAVTTDEIKKFTITVDVNADASLEMNYYIEWEVLDDKEYGPLEWMDIGVPNDHHENIRALSDTIDHIEDRGDTLAVYLDRKYYADETVAVEFAFTQDYMYQIDKYTAGETVYSFTPAWFNGMDIDELKIRWNAENVTAFQPDCLKDSGYLVFKSFIPSGETYTIEITYPADAFGFSPERQIGGGSDSGFPGGNNDPGQSSELTLPEAIGSLLVTGVVLGFFAAPVVLIVLFVRLMRRGSGFGSTEETKKKITRTKIEYFANCPSCGAVRVEGKDSCPYCGRSMIKSKEVVEENQLEQPENYTKDGTYRYGNSPNTYIHVHVVNIPVRHTTSSGSSSTRSHSSSSHHSSCACAHSCACASSCACACACASSGRAGCSVKDFFKESLHKGRIRVRKHS